MGKKKRRVPTPQKKEQEYEDTPKGLAGIMTKKHKVPMKVGNSWHGGPGKAHRGSTTKNTAGQKQGVPRPKSGSKTPVKKER